MSGIKRTGSSRPLELDDASISFVQGVARSLNSGETRYGQIGTAQERSVANGRGRGPICVQEMQKSKRFAELPNVTVEDEPVAMSTESCGFLLSCCKVNSFNAFRGSLAAYDSWYDGVVLKVKRIETHPDELLTVFVNLVSKSVFSVDIDLEELQESVSDNVYHLASTISNQNLLVRWNTFYNLLVGYITGLLCSTCDPFQKLYMVANLDSKVELLVHPELCLDMGAAFIRFVDMAEQFIADSRNWHAVQEALTAICSYATDPLDPSSDFPNKGQSGCYQGLTDYGYMRNMVMSSNASLASMFGCASPDDCANMFCIQTLQGLGFSFETLRLTLSTSLEQRCLAKDSCDARSLTKYVHYFLLTDDKMVSSLTQGPRVTNVFSTSSNETALDIKRLGCGRYLSRYSCSVMEDVTFTSVHIQLFVILGCVFGLVAVISLFVLWRNFTVTWRSRVEAFARYKSSVAAYAAAQAREHAASNAREPPTRESSSSLRRRR